MGILSLWSVPASDFRGRGSGAERSLAHEGYRANQYDLEVDWERNGKTSMTVEFELGRNIVGRWGVFVRPGVGIWGRDVIGSYDWNIEGGVRYIFPSF